MLRFCLECMREGCSDTDKQVTENMLDWVCLVRVQEHTFERGWM
jgi:hypothetical protein